MSAIRYKRAVLVSALRSRYLFGLAAIALRFREFHGTQFRWDDNAYASVVWAILLMHLIHLLVGTIEDAMMFAYISIYGLDDKHARDVRVTAVDPYWIAGIWVPLFAIVYFGPDWLKT